MASPQELLAQLPAVERVLSARETAHLLERFSRSAVADAVRAEIGSLRAKLRKGEAIETTRVSVSSVVRGAAERLERLAAPRLRPVVNATGVVLHTNIGRALLAAAAVDAVVLAAREPCTLEFDLASGERGDRDRLVAEHLRALSGAEAATVVNNNAAAVLLVLNTLAAGREVIVSRGELIEIGGSFRIPDIMAKSGARLREVGTTNRTHLSDYERAIGPDTALLLKVHPSNYRIVGFTASVSLEQLRELASRKDLPLVEDLGSGALFDLTRFGLPPEPTW